MKNGDTVRKAVAAAESESIIGKELAVRQKLVKAPEPKTIVFAQTVTERNPYVPDRPMRTRVPGGETTEVLPFYGTTEPTETSLAPRAWVIPNCRRRLRPPAAASACSAARRAPPRLGAPAGLREAGSSAGAAAAAAWAGRPTARMIASVVDRLEAHGIRFIRTDKERPFKGERFRIESNALAQNGSTRARTRCAR